MATKKYLSLEEACQTLGMSTEQVNKLREGGQLRGFADRGTWKFKADDVAEFARSRQVTSDPDVPLMADDDFGPSVLEEDADELADQPTLVRGRDADRSDSDVRLVIDDDLGETVPEQDLADSDSDVRLIGAGASPAGLGADSDSDVSLVGGSSTAEVSDSDVRLIGDDGDDSGVVLVTGDSSTAAHEGSGVISLRDDASSIVGGSVLEDEDRGEYDRDSQLTLAADSGIALDLAGDSSVVLEGADSGVTLGTDDSGLSLADEDAADAGSSVILLGDAGDSGISLSDEASGIGLGGAADSGIALDLDDDAHAGATQPMMKAGVPRGRSEGPETEADMAVLAGLGEDADSEFELATDSAEQATGTDTSVILFEDDDDEDDFADTAAVATAGASNFELDEEGFDEFDEDEPVASAEVLVDDDDELDVFEASDDDFDDDFASGVSHAEFSPGVAGPPPAEFDTATVAGLAVAAALLLFLGLPMMFDLVRSLWGYNEPNIYSDTLLGALSSLYG